MKKSFYSRFVIPALIISLCAVIPAGSGFSADNRAADFERAKESFLKGFSYFNSMNYLAAAEHFRKAVSVYPEYHTAREYLARSYRLAGYSSEARTEWEYLAKDSDSPLIKSKIDAINYRESRLPSRDDREFVESKRILSNDAGRYKFEAPIDIASDSEKSIYVTSLGSGKVVKFLSSGEGADSVSFGSGSKPYGIDCRNDRIAVSDFGLEMVHVLNPALKTLVSFGAKGSREGQFHGPEGVCIDESGNIYVADSGNNRVQKFSREGRFILAFGKEGRYEGELSTPTDVAVIDKRVYVSDGGNSRIAIFDDSGNFIENISVDGLKTQRGFSVKGRTLVICDEKAGICFYNIDTKESSFFKEWDDGKNSFSRVTASTYDRDGFLYALDHSRQAVIVLSPLTMRYTNLDVEIQSVDIKKYPMVAFYLSVRDRSGRPVYGLEQSNFEVVEDGARILNPNIDYFKIREQSITAALVVDRSLEAKVHADKVTWAADFFLKKLHKNDSVKIIGFNRDSWSASNFDWSRRRALKTLSENSYDRGKSFGRAIYGALGDVAAKQNRRAVILLTDGSVDQNSFRQYRVSQIIDYAREHFIQVNVVSFSDADSQLAQIARDTGGICIKASSVDSLNSIYDRIRSAEEYRYAIVYRSFKTDQFTDWWSDVSIKVDLKGVIGAEWGGYFVPAVKGGMPRSAGKMPTSSGAAPSGPAAARNEPAPSNGGGGGH